MTWRCAVCGRPHESDSGTCQCGSEQFERAAVRVTKRCTECGEPAAGRDTYCLNCGFTSFEPIQDGEAMPDPSYHEWRCEACGKEYPRYAPPCDRCGGMSFEQVHVSDVDVEEFVEREPWLTPWTVVLLVLLVVVFVLVGFVL